MSCLCNCRTETPKQISILGHIKYILSYVNWLIFPSHEHIYCVYLQHHAVVCRSLVLALVVLAVVDVNVIQLQKTHQISGCLNKHRHGSSSIFSLLETAKRGNCHHAAGRVHTNLCLNCAYRQSIIIHDHQLESIYIIGLD